ncbi:S26 family signal peptidase [Sphingomonas sp. CBMAI 2297]|uniref:S26 family signal peptidase n=1 Tax=Sphingomonas sp. CBMAI 2297 TaxID=2991720 RepID=UPI0024562BAE|nr:S26 family signal peptidase [Sphingomonas sp. CBMAI 2297]MDH4744230.1 S26 family signal peptidase [Sphingomonas sp. CBMAI 2297]
MNRRRPSDDAPLLAWGEARHAGRQRELRRLRLAILGGAALVLLTVPPVYGPAPRLVWNASASAPIGLYWVWPGDAPARGEMAIAWPPPRWRSLAAERHYLPANVPLVKRVAAVRGDLVCASGPQVSVNGVRVATRIAHDPSGRALPWWQGCRRLSPHEYLLLMDASGSFDGRYFGISAGRDLVGRARLIWRR